MGSVVLSVEAVDSRNGLTELFSCQTLSLFDLSSINYQKKDEGLRCFVWCPCCRSCCPPAPPSWCECCRLPRLPILRSCPSSRRWLSSQLLMPTFLDLLLTRLKRLSSLPGWAMPQPPLPTKEILPVITMPRNCLLPSESNRQQLLLLLTCKNLCSEISRGTLQQLFVFWSTYSSSLNKDSKSSTFE